MKCGKTGMIEYRYHQEKEFALHFAKRLGDDKAEEILTTGSTQNKEEATHLSRFFWRMVDKSIEDQGAGVEVPCDKNVEYWADNLYNSLAAYLEKHGFGDQWNREVNGI